MEINSAVIKVNSSKAHNLFGHCNRKATWEAAVEQLGWVISDEDRNTCPYDIATKAKQKWLSRSRNDKTRESNERVGIGIITVKSKKKFGIIVSKPNWLMVIDERSGTKISSFHKEKDDIVGYLAAKFLKYRNVGIPILRVWCDNAGENWD